MDLKRLAQRGVHLVKEAIAPGTAATLKPGDPAPAFEVADSDGTVWKSSDLLGKNVVLWFYPQADTPG
jgi:peroxiredoxin